jgi:hypothetical protein
LLHEVAQCIDHTLGTLHQGVRRRVADEARQIFFGIPTYVVNEPVDFSPCSTVLTSAKGDGSFTRNTKSAALSDASGLMNSTKPAGVKQH